MSYQLLMCLDELKLSRDEFCWMLGINIRTLNRWLKSDEVPLTIKQLLACYMHMNKKGCKWKLIANNIVTSES